MANLDPSQFPSESSGRFSRVVRVVRSAANLDDFVSETEICVSPGTVAPSQNADTRITVAEVLLFACIAVFSAWVGFRLPGILLRTPSERMQAAQPAPTM